MARLSKQFALVCLPALTVVGLLLVMLYQTTTRNAIIELGEQSNLSLAWATLSVSRQQVTEFLRQSTGESNAPGSRTKLDEQFINSVTILITETRVVRVKIYDANGIVAYSTKANQIGDARSNNPGFLLGMQGIVSSDLIVRESFDAIEPESETENLIHTYIPVQSSPTSPIFGVLEIYTNVDDVFEKIAKTQLRISIIVFIILGSLFAVLWLSTKRAEKTIVRQRTVIADRNHSLELLAERLSSVQEAERQRVSRELNEGLGQTLAAIKLQFDLAQTKSMAGNRELLTLLISQAMADVRRTAADLRPATLDSAGAISSILWYCRLFECAHPDIVVEPDLLVNDSEIPKHLATAVFRMVQETLRDLFRFTDFHWAKVSVSRENECLKLNFRIRVPRTQDDLERSELSTEPKLHYTLAPLIERAKLYGAQFSIVRTGEIEIEVTCTWSVANVTNLRTSNYMSTA